MPEKTLGQVAADLYASPINGGKLYTWEEIADAVIAAHEARRWNPIESAPKDGTPILCWKRDFANPVTAYWTNEPTTLSQEGGWGDGSTNKYDEYYTMEPTHWTPIPAPPKEVA